MKRAYFDNNATTAPDARVLEAMARCAKADFGNPSSLHAPGRQARRTVEDARAAVAQLVGADAREIVFAASGTEANNLAVFGLARAAPARRRVVIASPIEHVSVLAPLERLEKEGFSIRWLPVSRDGVVDAGAAQPWLTDEVAFAVLMWAQNEVGTLQPVEELAALCAERGIPLHTDAVQAAGKVRISVARAGVTTASFSAHKFHGPKGAAALYVKSGARWTPTMVGGGQERERRAGTENTPAIAGFGAAAEIAASEMDERRAKIVEVERRVLDALAAEWPEAELNARDAERVPGTLNVRFPGAHGETMLMNLDLFGVAVSLGAACSSGSIEASHVLKAMGLSLDENFSSLRISLSSMNTGADVEIFARALRDVRARRKPRD